jgi:hypothetical protein
LITPPPPPRGGYSKLQNKIRMTPLRGILKQKM